MGYIIYITNNIFVLLKIDTGGFRNGISTMDNFCCFSHPPATTRIVDAAPML